MRTRVKICCIASIIEARLAISQGADALGLVGPMPSGPGVVELSQAAKICAQTTPAVSAFLLTCKTEPAGLIAEIDQVSPATVQLVDAVDRSTYARLRERFPALKIVQVIHVEDEHSVDQALTISPLVDGLLLDSGRPGAVIKELGGTGRTHNWKLSRRIVEQSDRPVFLAGGLNSNNVEEAIEAVGPYGVDLCSGVRTEGHLDKVKLEAFIGAVRRADERSNATIA